MSNRLIISVKKTIRVPLPFAYQWLTDYRDDDPKITGSSAIRKVTEKTPSRVVYTTEMTDGGRTMKTRSVVSLKPPDRWDVDGTSDQRDYTGTYRLVPDGDITTITMTFDSIYKMGNAPDKKERELVTSSLWDKYIAALESEYRQQGSSVH